MERVRVIEVGVDPYLLISPQQGLAKGVETDCLHQQLVADSSHWSSEVSLSSCSSLDTFSLQNISGVGRFITFQFFSLIGGLSLGLAQFGDQVSVHLLYLPCQQVRRPFRCHEPLHVQGRKSTEVSVDCLC